ncbi:hypothetical protein [Comamonas odontotermitis]|uniref:hypothetical protein n=1 Tax=Comamonas odontotermitis TaxID=379895 RepID=UPI001CC54916|nr:hypothetical protein [Comamonas odontotermitis]UBB19523.1 hypothetical protein LAD35_22220 [Comamonas odontotermitis]
MSRAQSIAEKNGCDSDTAQRYLDLLDEGYSWYQAAVMSGMRDPDEARDRTPSITYIGADYGDE